MLPFEFWLVSCLVGIIVVLSQMTNCNIYWIFTIRRESWMSFRLKFLPSWFSAQKTCHVQNVQILLNWTTHSKQQPWIKDWTPKHVSVGYVQINVYNFGTCVCLEWLFGSENWKELYVSPAPKHVDRFHEKIWRELVFSGVLQKQQGYSCCISYFGTTIQTMYS